MSIRQFVKKSIYYTKYLHVGNNTNIDRTVKGYLKNVSVGDHSYIGENVNFDCSNAKVTIGNYCTIALDTIFITGNHITDVIGNYISENKKTIEDSKKYDKDINIENDVWIGARCIILKGVRIHQGAIIGAGSIVTKDVPEYTVYAGNPAKFIKNRFSEEDLKKHKQLIKQK